MKWSLGHKKGLAGTSSDVLAGHQQASGVMTEARGTKCTSEAFFVIMVGRAGNTTRVAATSEYGKIAKSLRPSP